MSRPHLVMRQFGVPLERRLITAWSNAENAITNRSPVRFSLSIAVYQAEWLIRMVFTSKRLNPRYNKMNIAGTLAGWAATARPDAPCPFTRLDFERMAIDILHLLKMRGEI